MNLLDQQIAHKAEKVVKFLKILRTGRVYGRDTSHYIYLTEAEIKSFEENVVEDMKDLFRLRRMKNERSQ